MKRHKYHETMKLVEQQRKILIKNRKFMNLNGVKKQINKYDMKI